MREIDGDVTQSDGPTDRLTTLCAQMIKVIDTPENADIQAIVFLSNPEKGGIVTHGYPDSIAAMADLFVHMKAIFNANGKDLQFVAVPDSPQGL